MPRNRAGNDTGKKKNNNKIGRTAGWSGTKKKTEFTRQIPTNVNENSGVK